MGTTRPQISTDWAQPRLPPWSKVDPPNIGRCSSSARNDPAQSQDLYDITSPKYVPRRPSPWHEIAHSLSETSIQPRRASCSGESHNLDNTSSHNVVLNSNVPPSPVAPPHALAITPRAAESPHSNASPTLSASQALREWEWLLSQPDSEVKRHQLLHPRTRSISNLHHPSVDKPFTAGSIGSHLGSPKGPGYDEGTILSPPKLAAERDKEGHIEYKLKLIEPSPDRFDRLVTQMLWRLKQGKNEAIYEIGLADDGTVIGLTRAEMDASLHTLELMASEVGATVLILKEIVLTGSATNLPRARHNVNQSSPLSLSSSVSSSAASLSSSAISGEGNHSSIGNGNGNGHGTRRWAYHYKRPDLDANGEPRRGTRSLSGSGSAEMMCGANDASGKEVDGPAIGLETGSGAKAKVGYDGQPRKPYEGKRRSHKLLIFDPADMASDESDEDEAELVQGSTRSTKTRTRAVSHVSSNTDEDIPPFHLDLDDAVPHASNTVEIPAEPPVKFNGTAKKRWTKRHKLPQVSTDSRSGEKSEAKRVKSAAKREARRLSLLRGDGMSASVWDDVSSPLVNGDETRSSTAPKAFRLPHQPARPSSLRLASPAPVIATAPRALSASSSRPLLPSSLDSLDIDEERGETKDGEEEDDNFLNLLHLPLDSLSLSFADVRNFSPPPSSHSSSTEYADPRDLDDFSDTKLNADNDMDPENRDDDDRDDAYYDDQNGLSDMPGSAPPPIAGDEMICVEALVVRKVQHGHAADGDPARSILGEEGEEEEEEAWGYGGEDDGWGFGAEDD